MNATNTSWNFFSNYAHVLVCLADNPDYRLRDVAERVGITERTAMHLVTQLEEGGFVVRVKEGRRNSYIINLQQQLRHPIESHRTVGDLLKMILRPSVFKKLSQS